MNQYKYKVQGVDYDVNIDEVEGNIAKVTVNGVSFEVEMNHPLKVVHKSKPVPVAAPVIVAQPAAAAAPVAAKPAAGNGIKVNSPLPGVITSVNVTVGQQVKANDVVVVLEAMKMQNNIEAEHDGVITSILVNKGESVLEGATLLTIG